MKAEAIQLVSKAIAAVIEAALPGVDGKDKVVVAPPTTESLDRAQILLFPYKLMVNTALRNTERVLPPPDPQSPPLVYNDSLPLDAFYLLTAGSSDSKDLDSLVWLGTAMQTLQQSPVLSGAAVDGDTVRISLEPVVLDEMSRIWTMFPEIEYRTSVVYVASPVWIDPVAEIVAAPVIDDRRKFRQRVA
jgi:hypothetical protein